jgi:hypothetical protein
MERTAKVNINIIFIIRIVLAFRYKVLGAPLTDCI